MLEGTAPDTLQAFGLSTHRFALRSRSTVSLRLQGRIL